jgi:hypothetical protein
MKESRLLCIKTNNGIYVNRMEFIDILQDIADYFKTTQKKRWFDWFVKRKEDFSIVELIRLLTAFG